MLILLTFSLCSSFGFCWFVGSLVDWGFIYFFYPFYFLFVYVCYVLELIAVLMHICHMSMLAVGCWLLAVGVVMFELSSCEGKESNRL